MKLDDLLATARDAVTARMVYAEPYEKDGLTVIPAARVTGGGGGGTGQDDTGRHGDGGGLGLIARPVGAFVIKDGEVRWLPAVDVNRLVTTLAGVLAGGLIAYTRRKK